MPNPRFVGVETEYGILATGPTPLNPVVASIAVVDAYRDLVASDVVWDHAAEHPDRDARGFDVGDELLDRSALDAIGVPSTVLTNGARLYVDHAHPEYATPECSNARDLVVWDRAGERILSMAARAAEASLPSGSRIVIHKNNTDGKGAAYGTHENYLVARSVPFGLLTRHLLPFFVSRPLFVGAGRIGSEHDEVAFQLTQRADFFEVEVGLETTVRRPIMNTRDEPHADPERFRRLHVINGDANLCEVATLLKVGTMMLVLDALEDGDLPTPLTLTDPVAAFRTVSHDMTCRSPLSMSDGRTMSAVDIQESYLDACRLTVERHGHRGSSALVLEWWQRVIDAVRIDLRALDGIVDWATKSALIDAFAQRHDLAPGDARLRMIDLQYHDVDASRGLHNRLAASGRVTRIVAEDEVVRAVTEPPEDTRAWFRGQAIRRFPEAVVAAGWDSLVIDVGERSLKRVPLLDPAKGTRALVGALLEEARDPADLLRLLRG